MKDLTYPHSPGLTRVIGYHIDMNELVGKHPDYVTIIRGINDAVAVYNALKFKNGTNMFRFMYVAAEYADLKFELADMPERPDDHGWIDSALADTNRDVNPRLIRISRSRHWIREKTGFKGFWQMLFAGDACFILGGMLHEIGHALGLEHILYQDDISGTNWTVQKVERPSIMHKFQNANRWTGPLPDRDVEMLGYIYEGRAA